MGEENKMMQVQRSTGGLAITFGQAELDLIKDVKCPGATKEQFNFFIYDSQSRGLNPLKNEIHWVARQSNVKDAQGNWTKKTVASHQVGIDGFRKLAQASGEYEGQTKVEFGDLITILGQKVPEYAEVGVWRKGFKEALYTRAYFEEYVQINIDYKTKDEKMGNMWSKMPRLMIAKCAEALALRKAFPAELAGLYTSDEMSQADNEKTSVKEVVAEKSVINNETGEIKETPIISEEKKKEEKPVKVVHATAKQEEKYYDLMDEYSKEMGWDSTKNFEASKSILKQNKVGTFTELSKIQAEKILELLEKKIAEKKTEKVKPVTIEEASEILDGEIIDENQTIIE